MNETKPILIYDGNCRFCIHWVARLRKWIGDSIEYIPSSEYDPASFDINTELFAHSVVYIDSNRRVFQGAEAVFCSLAVSKRNVFRVWLWMYRHLPGVSYCCERIYRTIAKNRRRFSCKRD